MLTSLGLRPALATLLTALALPASAVAAQPPALQLQVDASPDCTTREELMSRVTARTSRITFAGPGEAVDRISVRVVVTTGTRAVWGDLTITEPGSSPAVRRLSAPSCEQLTDAVALVIALAFDPGAAATPSESAAPPPAIETPPEAARPPPPAPPAPPPIAAPVAARGPEPARPGHLRLGAAAGAQVLFGPAPHPMPGVTVDVTLGWDRPSVWSPAARLSAGLAWSGALHETGGDAAFSLDTLTLDACPMRLSPGKLEVLACATGTLGRLGAAGSQTFDQASAVRPFAAAGGAAVVTLRVGQALEVAVRGSAGASWIRDAFAFAPNVFYRGAPLFLTAGLTGGVRFR
jgi:hypothetical protein